MTTGLGPVRDRLSMRLDHLQQTRILGAERDPFLHALLGLHVLCARFDALLAAEVAPRHGASCEPSGDELPLLALLGAVRLRCLLAAYEVEMREAATEQPRADDSPRVDDVHCFPNALLR